MYIWGIEPKRTWYLPPKPREKWLPWTEISAAAKGLTDIIMARSLPTPLHVCVCVWEGVRYCGPISEMRLPRLEKSNDMPKATVIDRGQI